MKLIQIKAKGLKGQEDYVQEFDSCTFLWGPNRAGKSRAFDALQLLVTGYHPAVPRNNDGILRLAAGDELMVTGIFQDKEGRSWTCHRRWERSEVARGENKGKVRTSSEVLVIHPSGSKLIKKEAEAAIAALAGQPYAVDLSALMGETDTGRRKLIFELGATAAGWTLERVNEVLKVENLHSVKECDLSARSHDDLVTWLEREYQAAKERTKSARSEVAQCREAAARLDKDAGVVEPADVGALRRTHEAAQERARQVSEQWARAEERQVAELTRALESQEARRQAEDKLQAARTELKQLREQGPASGNAPDTTNLREQIEELEEGFDGIPAYEEQVQSAAEAAITARIAEKQAQETTAEARYILDSARGALRSKQEKLEAAQQKAVEEVNDRLNKANSEYGTAEALYRQATEVYSTITERLNSSEDSFDEPTCPFCKQGVTESVFPKLEKQVAETKATMRNAKKVVEEAEYARSNIFVDGELLEQVKAAKEDLEQAEADNKLAAANYDKACKAVTEARHEEDAAIALLRSRKQDLHELKAKLRAAEATNSDADYRSRLAILEERVAGLEAETRKLVPDTQSLQAALDDTSRQAERARSEAKQAVTDAYKRLKDAEDKLTLYREAASVRQALIDAGAVYAETQRVEEALGPKGLMGRIVHDVLGPFEAAVNRCLEGLDLGSFQIRMEDERGNAVFHLGLLRAGVFSPVETLCHGEQASVHAAILVGLATLGDAPWRVVQADHLERLDKKRREAFLSQIVSLVQAGLVDQVIAAGCTDTCPNVEGLTVVEVLPTAE